MLGNPLLARSVELDPAALSAASARRFVRELLDEAGRREWADAAELVVSEVVTNAVLHAHTSLELTAAVEPDHIRVEVRDHNASLPSPREYGAQATTGRGMALVDALASAWGVQSLGPGGKVVWFCIGSSALEPSEDDLLAQWERTHPDDTPAPQPDAVRVVLRAFPPTLWLAARQHHDAALRELALLLAAHPDISLSQDDLAAADEARFLVSDALEARLAAGGEPATAAGSPGAAWTVPAEIDLEVSVRPDQAPAFGRLQDVLDESQRLAVAGRLLLPPALPEIIALRDWVSEQVISQVAGASASAWPGTDAEHLIADHAPRPGEVDWEPAEVAGSERTLVAADEANRILAASRSLAELLGWSPAQLVGRRVVTLVPPRYRQAHIAGFSRYLSTGDARILGRPVELPALRADGTEVVCTLTIHVERTSSGRGVFVAELQRLGE